MIKKIRKLTTITGKFKLPVDLLEVIPPINMSNHPLVADYIIGGFYNTKGYSMSAFYVCDKEGNILDSQPIIQEEGLNNYGEIFERYGYTFI